MTERAKRLLQMDEGTLFTHGGCHVFALALRKRFQYPLVGVRVQGKGGCPHIACAPEPRVVLDVFGWFQQAEYARGELSELAALSFQQIEEEQLDSWSTQGDGEGLYVHPSFLVSATEKANTWIERHVEHFNGIDKRPIPGLCRIKKASALDVWK